MSSFTKSPWLLVLVLVCVLAAVSFYKSRPDAAVSSLATPPDAAQVNVAVADSVAPRPLLPPQGHVAKPSKEPTHDEMLAKVEQNIRSLDDKFVAEPLDAAWANRTKQHLDTFFKPDNLKKEGFAAPTRVSTQCHSYTCRVSSYYPDETGAQDTTQMLTMHAAESLPYGAIMPRQLPDGSIEVNVWLSSRKISL